MSTALLIYNQLRASGISHAGALGLLGNWQAESGLEANRLQGDFSAARTVSAAYTADVTAGRITRTQFARDQKGYGLAQWTYFNFSNGEGRKLNLYDFWKQSGKALDDVSMQVSFALHELRTESQYAGLWRFLQTTEDLYAATDKVCRLYEQPYFCNVDARYRCALALEAELSNAADTPAPEQPDPDSLLWPPRTVDQNMQGSDVAVLQAVLAARSVYAGPIDGIFGPELTAAVRSFQQAHSLTVDGVCGPLTWAKILSLEA